MASPGPHCFVADYLPGLEAAARADFVIDNSGSMAGEKMDQARNALSFCLNQLNPQDRFNVIRFATDVEALFLDPIGFSSRAMASFWS